jgi:glucuronate isomerase
MELHILNEYGFDKEVDKLKNNFNIEVIRSTDKPTTRLSDQYKISEQHQSRELER